MAIFTQDEQISVTSFAPFVRTQNGRNPTKFLYDLGVFSWVFKFEAEPAFYNIVKMTADSRVERRTYMSSFLRVFVTLHSGTSSLLPLTATALQLSRQFILGRGS